MNTPKNKFTIQPPQHVGLSDKLWHLKVLYQLGSALSYEYVYTPFDFSRSYHLGIGRRILRLLKHLVLQARKRVFGIPFWQSDGLTTFLGLHHLSSAANQDFRSYKKFIDVDIDAFFLEADIVSADSLQAFLSHHGSDCAAAIYVFRTNGLYRCVSKIEQLVNAPINEVIGSNTLDLSQCYWMQRSFKSVEMPTAKSPLRVAIHCRQGDRTHIQIGKQVISIFANTVTVFDENNPALEAIQLSEHEIASIPGLITAFEQRFGRKNCEFYIISDGYSRTVRALCLNLRLLLSRGLNLFNLLSKINALNLKLQRQQSGANIHVVLGESNHQLFESIHILASSNVVIMSSGGFAYWVHTFLKPRSKISAAFSLSGFFTAREDIFNDVEMLLRQLD